MSEITIPSSPSWYLSNILACNDDGTALAYGAKHEVVILRQINSLGKPCDAQPIFIPMAHKDKVVALAFSPSNSEFFKDHLVTCSEDGSVHIWHWPSQFLILSHSGHPEGQKLVCVDWSRADPNLVVSVGDQGSVVSWDLPSNTIKKLNLQTKVMPVCIACCPHNEEIVGLGAKAGLIIVYNIKGNGHIVFRLRGHETDVVSLAWCPVPHNIFRKDNNDPVYLLASGAKDRNVYFWRAGGDGRYECFYALPTNAVATSGYRSKNGVGGQGSHWICVRWPEPNTLVTSSLFGELLALDLQQINNPVEKNDKNKKSKNKAVRLIHGNHSKGLFSIATPYSSKKDGHERIIWSYALDKHLIASKLESSKVLTNITTIGGIVYCMAVCPLDYNRIAIGTGDNRILVWNMSDDSCENVTSLWNKINNKVMAVAWHPLHESILAFGTGEGRIGIVDVDNAPKPTTLLRLYHRKSVYSLIWGPALVDSNEIYVKGKKSLALFSVGDGDILQYDPESSEREPISLNDAFKHCDSITKVGKSLGRTDLAWNHDSSLAAVGNENGVVYIVDGNNLSHAHTIFAHKKLVQCLVWHPATVTSESTVSQYSTWLASASDNIQIVEVTPTAVKTVASMSTHTEKVVSLAWSPHFNARLVSASYDYTSQVWDVVSGSVLACFDGHHSAVLCCLQSPLHPDCIITGSADSTVRVWNINKYKLIKSISKKQRLNGVMKKFAGAQEAKDVKSVTGSGPDLTNVHVPSYIPEHPRVEVPYAKEVNNVESSRQPKKSKSMFPMTSSGTAQARHLGTLWSKICGSPKREPAAPAKDDAYLDFFGDTNSIRRLLSLEENFHKNSGNITFLHHLSLWSGNISETIKEAIWKKELNDHLVSMAPMVSHKLWVDCCKSYSIQLAKAGETYKAVSYLLAVHQVEEAVELLIEAKHFREAVVLAKSRFPNYDPIVKRAMECWAENCVATGMLSLAAHCLLSCGSNIEAIEVLSRTKDTSSISLAAEIASKSDAQERAISLALRAINNSLEKQDFNLARNTALQHNTLKELIIWIELCSLISTWRPLDPRTEAEWICGRVEKKWASLFDDGLRLLLEHKASYDTLTKYTPNSPPEDSESKIWMYFCGQLSLALVSHIEGNRRQTLKHMISGISFAYKYHLLHPKSSTQIFFTLCPWLTPNGPLSDIVVYSETEKILSTSLRTFFASCVVYTLEKLILEEALPLDDVDLVKPLCEVVRQSSVLLFDKEIQNYYKLGVEIKKLENLIAKQNLHKLQKQCIKNPMKYCNEIEADLTQKQDPEADLSQKQDQKNSVDSSQPMSDGRNSPVVNGCTTGNETSKSVPPNGTVGQEEKNKEDDERDKYEKLKTQKNLFEQERIDTPNPFMVYCTVRNVIQKMADKNDTFKEIQDQVSGFMQQ